MSEKLSNRFCANPFEFIEVAKECEIFCCCPGWLPKSIGNFGTDELMDIWNSNEAREIRASILDGSFRYCRKKECPRIANNTLPLKTEISEPYLKKIIEEKLTILSQKPKILELSYDRSCNLSCPSCRTSFFMLKGEEYEQRKKLTTRLIQSCLDDIQLMIVTGSGDPFASFIYKDLLATLESDKYPHLRIHLMTNGQLFTDETWQKWHKIHDCIKSVQISIDAASETTYHILRRGGDYQKLLSNLEFIKNLKNKGYLEFVGLAFVVQALNYKEMKNFVYLCKDFSFDQVIFSTIRNWGTFSPEEFSFHAVHLNSHPEHRDFLNTLKDAIFTDSVVDLGNLTYFLPSLPIS
jgi:MoaA/NifB/PqqE/SkfB family radical SAM enzyme